MRAEPIRDEEYYDPEPEPTSNVADLFGDQPNVPVEAQPRRARGPRKPRQPSPDLPTPPLKELLHLALDILSFRFIMLLCCGASAVMFIIAIIWPDIQRLYAAVAFSSLVTVPVIYFYRKAH